MSTYSAESNKGTESSRRTGWYDCGTREIGPNSGNSPDGLNGSLSLTKRDREETGVEAGDTVLIRVRADGKELITERPVVAGGRQITLPVTKRRELDLSVSDEIQFSIIPLDSSDTNEDEESKEEVGDEIGSDRDERPENDSTSKGRSKQKTLTGDDTSELEEPYVLVKTDDPWTYHQILSENVQETVCGIEFGEEEHRTLSDPNGLEPCTFCSEPNLAEMSNNQKLKWLGRKIGFEVDDEVAYVKGEQYDGIIHHVRDQDAEIRRLTRKIEELESESQE